MTTTIPPALATPTAPRPTPARRPARTRLAAAGLGLLVAALGACTGPSTPVLPHDITVTQVEPVGAFTRGDVVNYTVTVINEGPGDSGVVMLTGTEGGTCVASGNAACPASGSPDRVENMPSGSRLVFTFIRTLPLDGLGVQTFAFSATSEQDTDTSNDAASFSITMVEARNGIYHVAAADGRSVDLMLDFTLARWSWTGESGSASGSLTSELVDGVPVYRFGNGGRVRTSAGGVVGENDFGSGPAPFFGTTAAQIYLPLGPLDLNVAARDLDGGAVSTHVETMTLDGPSLVLCTAAVPTRVADCPAADRSTWTMSVSGMDFTAVDDADASRVMHFRLVNSGATTIFQRAEADAAGVRRFRLGLADNAALPAATTSGGDTRHRWNRFTFAGDGTWQITHVAPSDTGDAESGTVVALGGLAPAGVWQLTRAADAATLWGVRNDALLVTVGAPGGAAAGELMITGQ